MEKLKGFFSSLNYFLIVFLAIAIKSLIKPVGFPEAIILLGLIGFEGYNRYLKSVKSKETTKEFQTQLDELNGKLTALNLVKNLRFPGQK